jgi:hypothetical protein
VIFQNGVILRRISQRRHRSRMPLVIPAPRRHWRAELKLTALAAPSANRPKGRQRKAAITSLN